MYFCKSIFNNKFKNKIDSKSQSYLSNVCFHVEIEENLHLDRRYILVASLTSCCTCSGTREIKHKSCFKHKQILTSSTINSTSKTNSFKTFKRDKINSTTSQSILTPPKLKKQKETTF